MELLNYINNVLNKYNFDYLYDNKVAIRVPTADDYYILEKMINDYCKRKYISVRLLPFLRNSNYIKIHATCINIGPETITNHYDININYCDQEYYIQQGYTIVNISDCCI
jgi:hypothetical protein